MADSSLGAQAYPHLSARYLACRKAGASEPVESSGLPWSWKVGRFAGVDVYIHATFLILLAWIGLASGMRPGSTPLDAALGIGFILALFGCVVLHEFGHALAARRYGIRTRDITLLPIGGIARLERMPRDPRQELIVALAGPAVNVAIGLLLYGVLSLTGSFYFGDPHGTGLSVLGISGNPLVEMAVINLNLVFFNMLPAFPMDGGRVLRALLSMKIKRVHATRIASSLGKGMALLFAFIGLFGIPPYVERNFFLLLIALFVYMGAAQEYQAIRWESAIEGLKVEGAMLTEFRTLRQDDPLSRAVKLLLEGTQHDFPVLDGELRVTGLLLRQDLIAALSRSEAAQAPVASAMRDKFAVASPDDTVTEAFERMQSEQLPVMPVFDGEGKLVGLLTMENVAEVVMVRTALDSARA